MRTLRQLGIAIPFVAATVLGFGAPKTFEGKIAFLMTSGKTTVPFTYYIKGGLIRAEMAAEKGQTGVILINPVKREMTFLMPGQKMYMVHQMQEPANNTAETQGNDEQIEFKRTGEYETILGYRCEKMLVKSKDGTAEIWGAEGMGTFVNPNGLNPMAHRGSAVRNAWEAEVGNRGFFPLRAIGHDNKGNQSFKMEATEIDKSTPADSLFVPPADYRKFEMPNLGGLNPFRQ